MLKLPLVDPSSTSEQLTPEDFLSKAVLANIIAVDTETNGLDIRDGRGFAVGISVAIYLDSTYYCAYFPVAHNEGNVEEEIKELLFHVISSRDAVVMHNAKFDIPSLSTAGLVKMRRWYCTMLMTHMLNENIPKGLDWLAKNELKEEGKVKKDFKAIWKMGLGHMIPVAEILDYACEDAVLSLKLFFRQYPYFLKSGFDGPTS